MPMSPRIESRVQESHFGAHGRKVRPAVLLARFFGGPETNSHPLRGVGFRGRFLSVASMDQVLRNRVQRRETGGTGRTAGTPSGRPAPSAIQGSSAWASCGLAGRSTQRSIRSGGLKGMCYPSASSRYPRTLATEEASRSAPMKGQPSLRAARAALARASINGSQITCPGRAKRWAIKASPALFSRHVRRS